MRLFLLFSCCCCWRDWLLSLPLWVCQATPLPYGQLQSLVHNVQFLYVLLFVCVSARAPSPSHSPARTRSCCSACAVGHLPQFRRRCYFPHPPLPQILILSLYNMRLYPPPYALL